MEKAMQKYLDKAEVLIEALPYIQRFNRKVIVVKYGGSAMVDEELKARVIQDVTLLKLVGFKPIIVHGGGKEISKWVGKVGMEPHFINGLRVTDAETMELAEMVLGKVNKSLVQLVEQLGVRAIGISGKDGGLLKVDKKLADGEDIGFVGDVKEVNADIIYDLLEKDFLPIICPVGLDDDNNTYNINADDAAAKMKMTESIIYSMTKAERANPDMINSSRKERIAKGCGQPVTEVNKLLKQFEQSRKVMKQLGNFDPTTGMPTQRPMKTQQQFNPYRKKTRHKKKKK